MLGGKTEIITNVGIKPIGDLVGKEIQVLSKSGHWVDTVIKSGGTKEVLDVEISNRYDDKFSIAITLGHSLYTRLNTPARLFGPQTGVELLSSADEKKSNRLQVSYPSMFIETLPSHMGVVHGLYSAVGANGMLLATSEMDQEFGDYLAFASGFYLRDRRVDLEKQTIIHDFPSYFYTPPNLNEPMGYLLGWLIGYFAAVGTTRDRHYQIVAPWETIMYIRDICGRLGLPVYCIWEMLTKQKNFMIRFYPINSYSKFAILAKHQRESFRVASLYWKMDKIIRNHRFEEVFNTGVPVTIISNNIVTQNEIKSY